jgi:hypothetical protein
MNRRRGLGEAQRQRRAVRGQAGKLRRRVERESRDMMNRTTGHDGCHCHSVTVTVECQSIATSATPCGCEAISGVGSRSKGSRVQGLTKIEQVDGGRVSDMVQTLPRGSSSDIHEQ